MGPEKRPDFKNGAGMTPVVSFDPKKLHRRVGSFRHQFLFHPQDAAGEMWIAAKLLPRAVRNTTHIDIGVQ